TINFQVVINKINLRSHLPAHCDWIGRPSELARALLYLLNNAVEAVADRPDPVVEVRLQPAGEFHRILISDSGPGIPPELREEVFKTFFTTKPAPHNGVGLYLAREIIKSFGGSIQIATPASGTGTEIIVTLPRNSAKAESSIPWSPAMMAGG